MPYRHSNHVRASTQQNLGFQYKRLPGPKYKIIPCPDCGAEVGQDCVTANGKTAGRGHVARVRLANRKLHEERS